MNSFPTLLPLTVFAVSFLCSFCCSPRPSLGVQLFLVCACHFHLRHPFSSSCSWPSSRTNCLRPCGLGDSVLLSLLLQLCCCSVHIAATQRHPAHSLCGTAEPTMRTSNAPKQLPQPTVTALPASSTTAPGSLTSVARTRASPLLFWLLSVRTFGFRASKSLTHAQALECSSLTMVRTV